MISKRPAFKKPTFFISSFSANSRTTCRTYHRTSLSGSLPTSCIVLIDCYGFLSLEFIAIAICSVTKAGLPASGLRILCMPESGDSY